MKVVVALIAAAAVVVKLGSGRDSQSSFPVSEVEEEPQRRLCGWRLANKLNKVCKGVYNKPGSTRNLYYYYRDRRGGGSEPVPPPDESLAAPSAARVFRYRPLSPRHLLRPYTSDVIDSWAEGDRSSGAIFEPRLPQELPLHSAQYNEDGGIQSGQSPFLTEAEASQVVRTRQPSKRGLSAECCRKVCTVSELVGYCY